MRPKATLTLEDGILCLATHQMYVDKEVECEHCGSFSTKTELIDISGVKERVYFYLDSTYHRLKMQVCLESLEDYKVFVEETYSLLPEVTLPPLSEIPLGRLIEWRREGDSYVIKIPLKEEVEEDVKKLFYKSSKQDTWKSLTRQNLKVFDFDVLKDLLVFGSLDGRIKRWRFYTIFDYRLPDGTRRQVKLVTEDNSNAFYYRHNENCDLSFDLQGDKK